MNEKKKAIFVGAGVLAAGLYVAKKAGLFDGAESGGSLGGKDDNSLTTDDNPFTKIDPNYQYPSETPYFSINPDGSTTPITSGDDGSLYSYDDTGVSEYTPDAPTGDTSTSAPWYDNPLYAGAAFAAGYLAVEGGIKGIKKLSKPTTKELTTSKTKGQKTKTVDVVREKLGFKSEVRAPQEEILRAKYTTDADFSKGAEVGKGGKLESTKAKLKSGTKGAAETAGKALIVGHVASRSFGAWNEFGSSMLEPRYNSQGEVAGATLGSTAKAVGTTGVVAAADVASDLFSFVTGIIYKPPTKSDRYKTENTGWFATEKDLWEAIKNPLDAIKGLTGYNEIAKSFGYVPKDSTSAKTDVNSVFKNLGSYYSPNALTSQGNAKSSITNPTVSASKNTSSKKMKTITVSDGSGRNRQTYSNQTGKKISSSDVKSAGSKGSNYVVITKKSGKKIIRNR